MKEKETPYEQEVEKLLGHYDVVEIEYYKNIINNTTLFKTEKQINYVFSVTEVGTNG